MKTILDRIVKIHWLAAFLFIFPVSVYADKEAGNRTYVTASDYGLFYAKSVPAEMRGLTGKTSVYRVEKDTDVLLHTYDWYSPEIYLYGFTAQDQVFMVQLGTWARGREASTDELAIAFYKSGKLLKRHSTLEIAKRAENVSASVSHYQVFGKRLGFHRPHGDFIWYQIESHDGKLLTFDTANGELLTESEVANRLALYKAQSDIQQVKFKWHSAQAGRADPETLITAEMLRPHGGLPPLPPGYRYEPSKLFEDGLKRN